MKRLILRICALLLLGAIVNIAVAWGIGLLLEIKPSGAGIGQDDSTRGVSTCVWTGWGRVYVIQGWGYGPMAANLGTRPIDGASLFNALPSGLTVSSGATVLERSAQRDTRRLSVVRERSVGWPAPALSEVWFYDVLEAKQSEEMQGSLRRPAWLAHIALPSNEVIRWQLPARPLWPGFAINTVFYAAILWGLFAAPFALRRWRRIKRGLCPKCAYDLRGHGGSAAATACPECGAPR